MSSSNSERSEGGVEAVDKHVAHPKLEKLKRLRETFNWKFENHPYLFLDEFGPLIKDWKQQLPNLHEIFTKQEMDWILMKSIKRSLWSEEIVEFVIRSGYKDEPDLDEDGKPLLRRTTAVHQIDEWHWCALKIEVLKNLFKIYDKFQVNYTNELGYTHFHVACIYGLDDVAEKFLELGQDPNCLVPGTGNSMLYCVAAAHLGCATEPIIRLLLKYGADPSQANEDGSTSLHVICQRRNCTIHSLILMLLESVDEVQQTFLINAQDKWGDTPLHLSLKYHHVKEFELLLRRGANPNSVNTKGQTPLHILCEKNQRANLLKLFFKLIDEIEKTVQIDVRDNEGNTPLHLAISGGNAKMVQWLLIRGADPSLANAEGLTPLHIICQRFENRDLLKLFFKLIDEIEKTVQIDVRDNEGNTPLHLAIFSGNALMVKSLLRRGADPSLANAEGLPPLHLIARRNILGDMIRIFLSINGERQQTVRIDARENLGRTALEWAVASCLPMAVKSLLDCGADVSSFVFPTPSDCDVYASIDDLDDDDSDDDNFDNFALDKICYLTKLAAATGLLAIVELLETRGYIMNGDDALKLMGFFDKYGLYESTDFLTSKEVDDLVDSIFEEIAENPKYMDDYKLASSYKLPELPQESREACSLRLCEKISTKFFRDWALDSFLQLIHYRLPIECCGMIMEELKNKDLFNICLAAAGRSSQQ
uniref:PRANC domain-containing protein n=1 Tax=Trichogramma kaykai TaxID=54128 RepID=A0ABD2XR05_9HYME